MVTTNQPINTAPVGVKGPRAEILREVRRAPGRTAVELAGHLGLSLNTVRHHLHALETAQLVTYARERHGVGAPVFQYRLTQSGEALFPQRYQAALLDVLSYLEAESGREAAVRALRAGFDRMAERLQPALAGQPSGRRLAIVGAELASEGYMAEWQVGENAAALVEHNCAMRAVAERYPELCEAELAFLAAVLGGDVERETHMLSGCEACGYAVRFPTATGTEQP